jgi:hypothetical protein
LATRNVKGCLLELNNIIDSLLDSGRLLIKSDKYLKKEGQGEGKNKSDKYYRVTACVAFV